MARSRFLAGVAISLIASSFLGVSAPAFADREETGVEIYLPAAFAEFLPQNAQDLVRRLPGFQVDEGDQARGLSGAQGNVLFNGLRPPPRGGSLQNRLQNLRVEDVVRLELIEAGARDVDMQGYPLLLNVVTRSETARRINGRMEIEPREDGGEETQLAIGGSMTGGRVESEGQIELYDEDLTSYADVRTANADNPTARVGVDQERAVARRDGQGSTSIALGEGRLLVLSGAYDGYAETSRPAEDAIAAGEAVRETREFDRAETSMAAELRSPLRPRLDLIAVLTNSVGDEERSSSQIEDGVLSTSASTSEFGETAARGTLRWRMRRNLTLETGATWAFNFLEGRSEAVIDGVVQDVDGSDARVEETRSAVLATASWTPTSNISASLGGRVERFSLNSTNALDGELSLTDVAPRADITWTLPRGWVARLASEREVGQLSLGQFLAETNLDNALNTAGAATLEPETSWIHSATLERRFGERSLVRFEASARRIDNPISRILDADGEVRPANIGPEEIDTLRTDFEIELDDVLWPGLLLTGEAWVRRSERVDQLQGFTRETSGHRDHMIEIGLRQEFAGGRYVLGGEIESMAPATHYWLTTIRKEVNGVSARLNGEWRHDDRWRTGFWTPFQMAQVPTLVGLVR